MTMPTTTSTPNATSSLNNNTCRDNNDYNDDESMTVLEILQKKRRLMAGCPSLAPACQQQRKPPPSRGDTRRATSTATVPTTTATGKEERKRQSMMNTGSHVDDNEANDSRKQTLSTTTTTTTTPTTTTKPGAVFVPGIKSRSSSYTDDDSDMSSSDNEDDENVLDLPSQLTENEPSSSRGGGGPAAVESSGVAIAIEVDEKQGPQITAVPVAEKEKNKQVPFHRTKLFCRISLIFFIAILIIGTATIAIVLAGYHDSSDGQGGYRETLGIRQEIEALVGTDNLQSAQSPYSKALDWIIHQDSMQLVPADSNFIQRYIMVYFYYATTTNGPWRSCNPVAGNELESCYHYWATHLDEIDSTPDNKISTRWLSSVHECYFAGVVCNDKMQVIRLIMSGNQLSGVFPVGIVHLPFLELIWFENCDLSGSLPKDLVHMEHLVEVNVGYNMFSGEVPTEWWRSRFEYLELGGNKLSGSIPSEIKYMTNVMDLLLEDNKFTGTIPTEIGELKSLWQLSLSDNGFKGPIPSELGQLEQLNLLYLSRNFLTGTIPPELGNLKEMWELNIHGNKLLGGNIPDSIYKMKGLTFVNLSECNFTGTISPMVGKLKKLYHFDISDNAFTGTVPVELAMAGSDQRSMAGVLIGINQVQVQNNNFQGNMPKELCELQLLESLVADCAKDPATGEVELQCDCCTECCDVAGICKPTYPAMNHWRA